MSCRDWQEPDTTSASEGGSVVVFWLVDGAMVFQDEDSVDVSEGEEVEGVMVGGWWRGDRGAERTDLSCDSAF